MQTQYLYICTIILTFLLFLTISLIKLIIVGVYNGAECEVNKSTSEEKIHAYCKY